MEQELRIITGPPADKLSKEAAHKALTSDPRFPKNASVEIEKVEGRWVAAVAIPKEATEEIKKESAPPFAPEESGPPEPTDGPPAEDGPPSDDAPSDDESKEDKGEDKPKGDEKGEGKGSVEHQIAQLTEMIGTLMSALGLGDAGSPVPGLDDPHGAPEGPPEGPPHGHEGPPTDDEGKTHTVHERALKPGEAPPGSTPVGAPAFASVADDHPWKGILGEKRTFVVEEEIGDATLSSVREELAGLAKGTGYEIKQLREGHVNGRRTAKALLQLAA